MSSSISSSSHRSAVGDSEWKVVVVVLAMLLGAEVCLRYAETRLSKDVAHIREAVSIAATLASPRAPAAPLRVLFMGNSSIREGLDNDLLLSDLEKRHGVNAQTWFFLPDGGNVNAWYWAWRRYFESAGSRPEWVVLCGGASHFDDGLMDVRAAGNYFVGWSDSYKYLQTDARGLEQRLEFVMGKMSLAYASRGRVQRKLTDMILPYNREVLHEIVNAPLLSAPAQEARAAREEQSEMLAAILAEIHAERLHTVVVAMPNLIPYNVPESRQDVIRESGAAFVDLRSVPGIGEADFYDKAHLNENGAKLFTIALAQALGSLMGGRD